MAALSKPHYDLSVLNSIPINQVVERFGHVKRYGVLYKSRCPWHEDTNPSLTLYENDRENHCYCFVCQKYGSNIDYVMAHEGCSFLEACAMLADMFHCGRDDGADYRTTHAIKRKLARQPKSEKPVEYTYIPQTILDGIQSTESSFCKCLKQLFDPYLIDHLAEEYQLGIYAYGGYEDDVVFPTIDTEGRIHNLKIQHYCTDPTSPDFCHCDRGHCYWLGSMLAKQGILPANAVFDNECMFGEHLLPRYPSNIVALVESPKNAICGAAAYPQFVWVATGNAGQLKPSVIKDLHGRQVIVFPDNDAANQWRQIIDENRYIANFSVFDDWHRLTPDCGKKYDIADYILSQQSICPF